jgi:hypothetical protein
VRPYEIYYAKHRWRGCDDPRPWVIVECRPNGLLECFPISGECYDGECFPMYGTHPDFAATGLAKDSYIHDKYLIELEPNEFLRRKGELTGNLLAEFRKYAGL